MSLAMIYVKLIIVLQYINFGYADKFHIVASGPCLKQGKNYCENIVHNSFCSEEKNECFCQNGFVAIKEKNELICKTLLTDLKCSTDRDCKDVYGSICHPGPGQCSCPAETFYLPQEHVCKYYSMDVPDIQCKICRTIGGKCYMNTSPSLTIIPKNQMQMSKCNCPGILFTPSVSNEKQQIQPTFNICQGIMVDLGSYCNDQDIICRTKIAECTYSSVMKFKICSCPKDYIAVYQMYLNYYECYPKIERMTKFCEHCQNSQGSCIDINGDGNEDSCYCGKWKTISNQEDTELSQQICRDNLLIIKCSSVHLEVCVNNDKYIPRKKSAINDYMTGIFQPNLENNSSNFCIVTGVKKSNFSTCFQISKSIQSKSFENNCSTVSFDHENSVYYNTFLMIPKDKFIFDPINDFNFDISCKADLKKSKSSFGQITDRSWKGELTLLESRLYDSDDLLSYKIIDVHSKNAQDLKMDQMFGIDVHMKRRARLNYFIPEKCSVQNGNLNQVIYSRIKSNSFGISEEIQAYVKNMLHNHHRSLIQSNFNSFSFSLISKTEQTEPYKLRSNSFPSFISKLKGKSRFTCIFRLCEELSWCNQNFDWSNLNDEELKIPKNFDDIKFIESHFEFSFGNENCCSSISVAKENKDQCLDLLCLTPAQILTMVISVCTLTILLSCIVIVLFKKRNNNKYPPPKNGTKQNDTCEISILNPKQTSFHRVSIDDPYNGNCDILLKNNFTDDQCAEHINSSPNDFILAKEYDFYVNLSALNSGTQPGTSVPISMPNNPHVVAEINNDPSNVFDNQWTMLNVQPLYHIQHHVCDDKVKTIKCSKSTAV